MLSYQNIARAKAIEFLRIHFEYLKERWKPHPDYNVLEAIRFAISAIEKQIPKKPKVIDRWRMCPRCYEEYGFDYDILIGMRGLKTGECRCLNCGQVLELDVED